MALPEKRYPNGHKYRILFCLALLALSPSAGFAQSSGTVTGNTSVRGLKGFQRFPPTGSNSSVYRFGYYASRSVAGINYSAPPRTSANPLAGSRGIQTPRSTPPARDFRMSSGLINTRAASTRLSGGIPSRSALASPAKPGNFGRLAFAQPVAPIRRIQSNPFPLSGSSGQAFSNRGLGALTNRRTGGSSLTKRYGLSSRRSLSQLTSMGRSLKLSERKTRSAFAVPLSQRGLRTTSRTQQNRGITR